MSWEARLFSGPCVARVWLGATLAQTRSLLGETKAELTELTEPAELGQPWTEVELLERSEAPDYLQPLFRDVLRAIDELPDGSDGEDGDEAESEPEPGDDEDLVYDTPLRAAQVLTTRAGQRRLGSGSALVFWGSDEGPGLGGAAEVDCGQLLTVWSVFPGETIADCYAERRRWARHDDEYPGLARPDDELYRWDLSGEGQEERLAEDLETVLGGVVRELARPRP